jgi:hypothetical protein
VSQPTPDDQVPSPDPDPLLEFFAEPESQAAAEAAAPVHDRPETIVKAEDTSAPAAAPVEPDSDPELRKRLDRAERLLEKAQVEISTLKSDCATLVSTIDDIKKRQSRPASVPPTPPINLPSPQVSRVGAAAAVIAGIILAIGAWGAWSIGSYDMPELATEVGAAAEPEGERAVEPVVEPAAEPADQQRDESPVPVAAVVITPAPAVEIQKTAAVSVVEPPRKAPARSIPSESIEREPRSAAGEYVGTLSIDASPGGEVFVDRKSVGQTPVRLERLRAGSHLVWIERDGFRRWTRVVSVAANRVSRVSAELDRVQ